MGSKIQLPLEKITEFCRSHHVRELSLFGSVLSDSFNSKSDIDMLVSFKTEAHPDLIDFVQMQDELAGILGRDVDLIEKEALQNPFLRHSILSHKEIIY